jgi:MSHA pilin protein MshA
MKNLTNLKMNKQKGFTLIELVVVIVILGILAVTAAPKFINLQDDARTATLQAVKASMQSASTLVFSKSLIKGNESAGAAATNFVTVNGSNVLLRFGHPRDNNGDALANWKDDLLDLNEAEFTTAIVDGSIVVYPVGKPAPTEIPVDAEFAPTDDDNCFTFYTETSAVGVAPNIQVVECL